jgi:hypothetical protein
MPQTQVYLCQCSKCHGKAKFHTKRTIETHLNANQCFLQSLPQDAADLTGNHSFVESCITQTIQLLSRTCLLPHTAPDAERSCLENSEGVQLSIFHCRLILTLLSLFITLKQPLTLQIIQISRLVLRFLGNLTTVMP